MHLCVTSEIGPLEAVMVHQPGSEIERMVPALMEQMLFDDILFASKAQAEHRRFQRVLSCVAGTVIEFRDALEQSLASIDVRNGLVKDLASKLGFSDELVGILRESDAALLAEQLIAGVVRPGLQRVPERPSDLYLLQPVPNIVFHRDPAVVVGEDVMLGSMSTAARLREPLLLRHILKHHPQLGGARIVFDRFDRDFGRMRSTARPRPCIEGGDVLVARDDLLLVGRSARTKRKTIDELAQSLIDANSGIRTILVVDLPNARSYMHLDTVFTLLSDDACLLYEPVIAAGGAEQAAVYQLKLDAAGIAATSCDCLISALRSNGFDLRPIYCGGPSDPIAQQREQWTDGANAFCLAPGVALLYERNVRTAEELQRAGFCVLRQEELLSSDGSIDLTDGKNYVVLIEGPELSRARGGPRCLTMPLRRGPAA